MALWFAAIPLIQLAWAAEAEAAKIDTGDTAFMLICTALVLLMTPGLAFFYGGLVRSRNVLNTMMMSLILMGIVGVAWCFWGYSLAFDVSSLGANGFAQGIEQLIGGYRSNFNWFYYGCLLLLCGQSACQAKV
jgi:ammonium transporter, Amt family